MNKKRCVYTNKTQLFAQKGLINFKDEPYASLEFTKQIARRCYEKCGDNKCAAYYNFMKDIAEDYKKAQEENKHGRK